MNDNDIFIKREESVKAWKLLQQEGFTIEPVKSPLFKKIMFDFGQHLPALYKKGYAVEIHNNLFDRRDTDDKSYNDPFSDAVEITIGDTKAFILPECILLNILSTILLLVIVSYAYTLIYCCSINPECLSSLTGLFQILCKVIKQNFVKRHTRPEYVLSLQSIGYGLYLAIHSLL
jgi:hypothetical protein